MKIKFFVIAIMLIALAGFILIYFDLPSRFLNRIKKSNHSVQVEEKTTDTFLNFKMVKVFETDKISGRDGASLIGFKGKLWLLGGWNVHDTNTFINSVTNEIWSSADGKDWELMAPLAPANKKDRWSARHLFATFVVNNKIWIFGGDALDGKYKTDVWNSEDGIHWTKVLDSIKAPPRALANFAYFNKEFIMYGGQTVPEEVKGKNEFFNDVWASKDGIVWSCKSNKNMWTPRGTIIGQIVLNDKLFIIGGGTYPTKDFNFYSYFSDVWESKDAVNWVNLSFNNEWQPRIFHTIDTFDNKAWIIGGAVNDLIIGSHDRHGIWLSEDLKKWANWKSSLMTKRHAAASTVFQNKLWIFGGSNLKFDIYRIEKRDNK